MNPNKELLDSLLASREFRDAVEEALRDRIYHLGQGLRSAARGGDAIKAAHTEGQIMAYEGILTALDGYVKRSGT